MDKVSIVVFSKKEAVYQEGLNYRVVQLKKTKKGIVEEILVLSPKWEVLEVLEGKIIPKEIIGDALMKITKLMYSLGRSESMLKTVQNPNVVQALACGGNKFPLRIPEMCPMNSDVSVFCIATVEGKLAKSVCSECSSVGYGISCSSCGNHLCLKHYAIRSSYASRFSPVFCIACGSFNSISGTNSKLGAELSYKCGYQLEDVKSTLDKGLNNPYPQIRYSDDELDILYNTMQFSYSQLCDGDKRFPCPDFGNPKFYPKDFNDDTAAGIYAGVPKVKKSQLHLNAVTNIMKVHDNALRMADVQAAAYISNYIGTTVHGTASKIEVKEAGFVPFPMASNQPNAQKGCFTSTDGGRVFFMCNLEAYLMERMAFGPFTQYTGFGRVSNGVYGNVPPKIGINFTHNAGIKIVSELTAKRYVDLMNMTRAELFKFDTDYCATHDVICGDKSKWDLHVTEFWLWVTCTLFASKIDFGSCQYDEEDPHSPSNVNRVNRLFFWAIVRSLCIKAVADPIHGVYLCAGILASGRYLTSFLNSFMNTAISRFLFYIHQQTVHKIKGPFSQKFFDDHCGLRDLVYGDDDIKSFDEKIDRELWINLWAKYANQVLKPETVYPVKNIMKWDGFHTSPHLTANFLKCFFYPYEDERGRMSICMCKPWDKIMPKLFVSAEKVLNTTFIKSRLLCVGWTCAPNRDVFDVARELFMQLNDGNSEFAEKQHDNYYDRLSKRGYEIGDHFPYWNEAMGKFMSHENYDTRKEYDSWDQMSQVDYENWNGSVVRTSAVLNDDASVLSSILGNADDGYD
jgi:hypothetical protein